MKVSGISLVFAFTFMSLFTSFMMSLVSAQQYSMIASAPNWANYLSATAVWNNLIALMGGHWYVFGVSFAPVEDFFAGILFAFYYMYSFFAYIIAGITWLFGFFTYPYQFIPYPINYLFGTAVGISILIILIFGIRIVMSGLSSGE